MYNLSPFHTRQLSPSKDHKETGRWDLVVRDLRTREVAAYVFDAVMVCTGYDATPVIPCFPGLRDKFRGRVLHTRFYKRPAEFQGKRVLVVGIGNSAADVAVELSAISDAVSSPRATFAISLFLFFCFFRFACVYYQAPHMWFKCAVARERFVFYLLIVSFHLVCSANCSAYSVLI